MSARSNPLTDAGPIARARTEAEQAVAKQRAEAIPVRFWMVWNKNAGPPKATHETYERAAFAACALARKHPGEKFIVLQAQKKFWFEAPPMGGSEPENEPDDGSETLPNTPSEDSGRTS